MVALLTGLFGKAASAGMEARLTSAMGKRAAAAGGEVAEQMFIGEVSNIVCDAVHSATGVKINSNAVTGKPSAATLAATVASTYLSGKYSAPIAQELSSGKPPSETTMRHVGFSPEAMNMFRKIRGF
jgi:hypothetical protein